MKKLVIFCAHMIDFRRPSHIYTHVTVHVVMSLKEQMCNSFHGILVE